MSLYFSFHSHCFPCLWLLFLPAPQMSGNQPSTLSHNLTLPKSSDFQCFLLTPASEIYIVFFITNMLILLPPSIFIIHLGVQRWRRRRRLRSSAVTISPLDCIAYNVVTMELFGVLGQVMCCCGIYKRNLNSVYVGWGLWSFSWHGETFFNILTCLEHYLAVVHPIAYLRLKGGEGPRIRRVTSGCAWLLSLGFMCLVLDSMLFLIADTCILIFSVIVISFFSVSVLCCLIRPRPGEQGGKRDRVDQSKHRAFFAISVILVTLLTRCIINLIWAASVLRGRQRACASMAASTWSNVPGSLVLPLLFFYRGGVFLCQKNEKNKKNQIGRVP